LFPDGVRVPEPQAMEHWWNATNACKGAQSFSAEIGVSGNVGTEKLRRVKLQGAMTRKREIYLLAVAPFGAPIFTLSGHQDRATLTLPREKRVLTAPAADIVEALIGLRLGPDDWLDLLSSCVTDRVAGGGFRLEGMPDVMFLDVDAKTRLRLERNGAAWRIVAGKRADLLVEYGEFQGSWPGRVALTTPPGAAVAVDLTMTISQIFVNTDLSAALFAGETPAGFQPMTLNELRAIGPLGESRAPAAERSR
jgi:hypothetical protein